MNFSSIILAAGKGTRMNSDLPKVLHQVNGKSLVNHVIDLSEKIGVEKIVIVVGHKKEQVIRHLKDKSVEFAVQEEQLGTGHAVLQTEENLKSFSGNILILYGDVPLLSKETLNTFIEYFIETNAVCSVLTADFENPFAYGRIIRDRFGNVERSVEEKDASEEEKKIKEINSCIYAVRKEDLFDALHRIDNNNAKGEYYLTDIIEILNKQGKLVNCFKIDNPEEIMGVNTPEQLKEVETVLGSKV